jgi:hypothetical protein
MKEGVGGNGVSTSWLGEARVEHKDGRGTCSVNMTASTAIKVMLCRVPHRDKEKGTRQAVRSASSLFMFKYSIQKPEPLCL